MIISFAIRAKSQVMNYIYYFFTITLKVASFLAWAQKTDSGMKASYFITVTRYGSTNTHSYQKGINSLLYSEE